MCCQSVQSSSSNPPHRCCSALHAAAQQLVALDNAFSRSAAFRSGHGAEAELRWAHTASYAAAAQTRLCLALQLQGSELMPVAAAVAQFVLRSGRPALATQLATVAASPVAKERAWAAAGAQLTAMSGLFKAGVREQLDLADMGSTALQPHALLAWLTTISDALVAIQPGESCVTAVTGRPYAVAAVGAALRRTPAAETLPVLLHADYLAYFFQQYMGVLVLLLRFPACRQHAAALAASPRAQAAVLNFVASCGMPALVAGFQTADKPAAGVACCAIAVLIDCLQHAALEPAFHRRLRSPGGAVLVQLAAQLCRQLPSSQPGGWAQERYLGLHRDAASLFCLLAGEMRNWHGADAPDAAQRAAISTEQLAAARELVRTLPQLAATMHTLSGANAEPGRLLKLYSLLGTAVRLLDSVRFGGEDATGSSQLTITSQTDLDDWLAACEAAVRLVPLALRLKEGCAEVPASIAVLDDVACILLLQVWVQGPRLVHCALGSESFIASGQRPALQKRVWQLHVCGCRLLHAALTQLPGPGVQALLEGLHQLVAAAECPETDGSIG